MRLEKPGSPCRWQRFENGKQRKRNLIAHWLWYADIETSDRFLKAPSDAASLLATQPEAGHRFLVCRPELQGIRRFPLADGFEKILLFYFPLEDGVEMVRVVHGSRDLEPLLMAGLTFPLFPHTRSYNFPSLVWSGEMGLGRGGGD